jgi:hypothetical protein
MMRIRNAIGRRNRGAMGRSRHGESNPFRGNIFPLSARVPPLKSPGDTDGFLEEITDHTEGEDR